MKKNAKILIYLFFVFLFIGCEKYKDSNEYTPRPSNYKLKEYANVSDFKSLFNLTDSIQLENSKEAILGYAWEASKIKNNFVVSDPVGVKSVKAYNESGNFIERVGGNGRGPDEYISPDKLSMNNDYVVIFDPTQLKIIIFNNKFEYKNSWKVSYYIEKIVLDNKNKLIVLRKPGYGYKYDLDVYDVKGNLINTIKLPKSSKERNRAFLFGGSYKIAVQNNRLYYIGGDEFKILCYNIDKREFEWASTELPDNIKIPDIPPNLNNLSSRKRIAWMKENYTPLRGFYIFENGLQLVHIQNNFLLFDDHGNYLTQIKVDDKDKIYFSKKNNLFAVTFPVKINEDIILNPQIYTYKLKDISL